MWIQIVLGYLFIGLIIGLIVERLAKIPGAGIAEVLGSSLNVRLGVVLGWPIVAIGVLVGLVTGGDEGPTPTGS